VVDLTLGIFWMEGSLGLMEETLGFQREAFGGPTFHFQAQKCAKSAKTLP
jgi:hypothetical protein